MSNRRRLVLRIVTILLMVVSIPLNTQQVHGQEGIVVEDANVAVSFGQSITFSAKIKSSIPIKQASLLFRGVNEDVTRVETVQVAEDGSVSFTYDASLNLFPPFSWIVFWYQATLTDDQTYTSAPITFLYNDDRFPWREMSQANVTVHWYAGDDTFGATALNAAGTGMLVMNEFIPVSLSDPVEIYIYSNVTDLKNTLQFGGEDWTGGHTNPKLGVVLVAIAPGENQSIEMETKIPHELTHVMLYRSLGEKYTLQPAWLIEGIASAMELYPNPDYANALDIASRSDSLISFDELCASFPADAGNAYLAYAQSQSFVTYIRNTYGISGLTRLTEAYSDGVTCELGATNALGTPLSQLDARWRESVLGQNLTGVAARNLSPFILLMILVLLVPIWGAIDLLRLRRKRGSQPS
ncbi:MAG: hypothetical protein HY863_07345 [Chloroflexi bacterium]|nr:hypothetical protein [Chloroflexota bacterium]